MLILEGSTVRYETACGKSWFRKILQKGLNQTTALRLDVADFDRSDKRSVFPEFSSRAETHHYPAIVAATHIFLARSHTNARLGVPLQQRALLPPPPALACARILSSSCTCNLENSYPEPLLLHAAVGRRAYSSFGCWHFKSAPTRELAGSANWTRKIGRGLGDAYRGWSIEQYRQVFENNDTQLWKMTVRIQGVLVATSMICWKVFRSNLLTENQKICWTSFKISFDFFPKKVENQNPCVLRKFKKIFTICSL